MRRGATGRARATRTRQLAQALGGAVLFGAMALGSAGGVLSGCGGERQQRGATTAPAPTTRGVTAQQGAEGLSAGGAATTPGEASRAPVADYTHLPKAKPYPGPTALLKQLGAHVAPVTPRSTGPMGPTLATTLDAKGKAQTTRKGAVASFDAKRFQEHEKCALCHADVYQEWSESMHRFASLSNPIYKTSFDDFRKTRGEEASSFCAGCHDPGLLFTNKIKQIKPAEPLAHAGITCATCHGIQHADPTGNGSYQLTTSAIIEPHDDKTLKAHRARVAGKQLREKTNQLCASCHRGFLSDSTGHGAAIAGFNEVTPWRRSPYNGVQTGRIAQGVKEQNCVSCHMPKVDGHRSHRFPGGHTTFAAMIGSKEQLAAAQKLLEDAATLDLFIVKREADTITFDVLVYNERTGHHFPGGVRDMRDTWLEVSLHDTTKATPRQLGSAGTEHARTGEDPTAERFRAGVANRQGALLKLHEVADFRTKVFDHTIAPRDAVVVRYVFKSDQLKSTKKLKIHAKLRHRRVTKSMMDEVCKRSKTAGYQAFAKGAKRRTGKAVDPCVTQPITEVHNATLRLDGKTQQLLLPRNQQPKPAWARQYLYGVGLQHHVQEDVDEASAAFQRALKLLPKTAKPLDRAMIQVTQAQVLARQGRTEEAVALFRVAEKGAPGHPSVAFGTGQAHMRVWQFDRAVSAYAEATRRVQDDRVWRRLAIALGSRGDGEQAAGAAARALAVEPRDSHALRVQMLSHRTSKNSAERKASFRAFDRFKRDELANTVRDLCSSKSTLCRRGRLPIRTFTLRPTTK